MRTDCTVHDYMACIFARFFTCLFASGHVLLPWCLFRSTGFFFASFDIASAARELLLQKEGKLTPLMLMMLMLWCWCANAFACIWLHFATSDCIWLQLIHLIASGCIQSHLIASDRIWSHLIASDPIGWLSPATHSATHLKPSYWHNPWHDLGAQALTWRRNCTASFQAIWEEGQHTVYVYTVCAKVTCCKNVAAGNVAIMFF